MIGEMRFKLPEEQQEWDDACNGAKWRGLVQAYDNVLRRLIKHESKRGTYIKAHELLWDLLNDSGLDLWD